MVSKNIYKFLIKKGRNSYQGHPLKGTMSRRKETLSEILSIKELRKQRLAGAFLLWNGSE